jgi:hypothetical protein
MDSPPSEEVRTGAKTEQGDVLMLTTRVMGRKIDLEFAILLHLSETDLNLWFVKLNPHSCTLPHSCVRLERLVEVTKALCGPLDPPRGPALRPIGMSE